MNLFKKVVATIALTTLVATTTVSGVSAYSTASADAAKKLAEQGVIVAHENVADYKLDSNVLRQEVAAMAFSIAKLEKKATCENEFKDVSATEPNTWACYVVEPLRDNGYLAKNEYFRPEANISKAEALGMVVSAAFGDMYKYDATKGTSWQEQLVDFAVNNGILAAPFTDYNTPATRGIIFEWTVNAIEAAVAEEDDLGLGDLLGDLVNDNETTTDTTNNNNEKTTTDTTNTNENTTANTSDLMVELNPETPAGADLPREADGVLVMKLDLTAGNEDTSVTELNFERIGFGQIAADGVALFANGARLTKFKTFNSDDEANISISPALVIKAGETVTVDVRVDTASTDILEKAGITGDADFAVKLTGVTASTDVEANEVVSNTFTVKTTEATKLLFKTGSVNSQVTAGETDAEVAEFDLQNDGNVNNSDITVTSITLKEVGTIDQETELANLKLVHDGEVVASVSSMADKYVTFNLDNPVVIKDGKTETFKVTADITGGADDFIKFILDTDGDIVATATKYNAVNVVNQFAGQSVSVQAGELTIYAIDAENDKVRDDTDDVVLGQLKIVNVAGKDLEIDDFGVNLTTTNSGVLKVLENVKAEINGTSYDLYAPENTSSSATVVNFSDTDLDITLPQGTTIVTILADTLDDLTDGTTITMSLDVNNTDDDNSVNKLLIRESEDDTKVKDITPSNLTWNDVEIKQPLATVSKTPLANVSVVKGTSDVVALQFDVEANEVSPLTIDKVNVNVSFAGGYGNSTKEKDYVTEVKLYKNSVSDSNKLDAISGNRIANDGTAQFDGFEVAIPENGTQTFIVTVSTADSDDAVNGTGTVTLNSMNIEDDDNDTVDTDPVDLSSITGKTITIKDSGKLDINVASSADNDANQDSKTILAGTEQIVFSVDTKATNEEIDVERIKFVVSATGAANDLKDSIKEAKLFLGDNLVATTPNSKVTAASDNNSVEVYFKDMTNTIIPTTSDELKLSIVTESIGYEKVGKAISSAKLTAIKLDENYVKGVESNEKVQLDNQSDLTEVTLTTGTNDATTINSVSKTFAIVPMIVTPSVTNTFGTDDNRADISIATDAGDNTSTSDGSSLTAKLKVIRLIVTSVASGDNPENVTLFNGNGDPVSTTNSYDTGSKILTITVTGDEYISNGESYEIEASDSAEASYKLAKNGVSYEVDSNTYTTNLDDTQDMGTYSKSN